MAPGFADIIIAATAQHHGLTILTRNLRHFEPLGAAVHDPFVRLPRARSWSAEMLKYRHSVSDGHFRRTGAQFSPSELP
ncbi:PIN domain-containing protein [Acidocella facilis]|uniref:hypothetical protein n=1 Tax=Acidocella facilis TaxID=525 RepID=UPI001FD21D19|nr:hypothetical protein [Acidocella facilis]